MTYLYSPPTWRNYAVFEGSLRYSVPTSFCVYRKSGTWVSTQSPGIDELEGIDTDPSGLLLLFTRPAQIPDSLVSELTSFGQGTLTHLS